MSGSDFIEALKAAVSPRTIDKMTGKTKHIAITLSDGTVFEVDRRKAKADPKVYVTELLA
jgi:hypothetical protein